jgi:AcrR family transcriptional regulator
MNAKMRVVKTWYGLGTMSQQEAGVPAGLRERKKLRTREAIVDAAFELFEERGFEATTIADIAAAADIAPRTFFGYFATKEDVVTHDFGDLRSSLRARLTGRRPGETAMDALRGWLAEMMQRVDFSDPRERCRQRLVRESEALQAHEHHMRRGFEETLAEGIALDLGVGADTLRPRMVAAAAVSAMEMLQEFYGEKGEIKRAPEQALAIVDEALAFVQGGIDALQSAPAAPPPRGG